MAEKFIKALGLGANGYNSQFQGKLAEVIAKHEKMESQKGVFNPNKIQV